jgi:hypothetical protein
MTPVDSPVLFVSLQDKPELYVISDPAGREVLLGGSQYLLVNSEAGFYDFLRDGDKAIIGLRFSPFQHSSVLDYALPLSYTYVNRERDYVEIYFRGHRGLSVPGSAEQAFGDDRIWRNSVGVYALQVGTTTLTQGELESLKGLAVVA